MDKNLYLRDLFAAFDLPGYIALAWTVSVICRYERGFSKLLS